MILWNKKITRSFFNWWTKAQRFDSKNELIEVRVLGKPVRSYFFTSSDKFEGENVVVSNDPVDSIVKFLGNLDERATVSFSVVPRVRPCGTKECARDHTYVLWFDLDLIPHSERNVDETLVLSKASIALIHLFHVLKSEKIIKVNPEGVVMTLTGHGVHVYVPLGNPVKCSQLEGLKSISVRGFDSNVLECSRVMRIPGTINWNVEGGFKTKLLRLETLRI